jgi:hypothetical protein
VEERCFEFENENRALPTVEDREIWIRAHDIAARWRPADAAPAWSATTCRSRSIPTIT